MRDTQYLFNLSPKNFIKQFLHLNSWHALKTQFTSCAKQMKKQVSLGKDHFTSLFLNFTYNSIKVSYNVSYVDIIWHCHAEGSNKSRKEFRLNLTCYSHILNHTETILLHYVNYSKDQTCQASIRQLLPWALYRRSTGWWFLFWNTHKPLTKLQYPLVWPVTRLENESTMRALTPPIYILSPGKKKPKQINQHHPQNCEVTSIVHYWPVIQILY